MNLLFKLMLRPLMPAPAGSARERRLLLAFIEGGGLGSAGRNIARAQALIASRT